MSLKNQDETVRPIYVLLVITFLGRSTLEMIAWSREACNLAMPMLFDRWKIETTNRMQAKTLYLGNVIRNSCRQVDLSAEKNLIPEVVLSQVSIWMCEPKENRRGWF